LSKRLHPDVGGSEELMILLKKSSDEEIIAFFDGFFTNRVSQKETLKLMFSYILSDLREDILLIEFKNSNS